MRQKLETSERRSKGSAKTFKFDILLLSDPFQSIGSISEVVLPSENVAHIGVRHPNKAPAKAQRISLTN